MFDVKKLNSWTMEEVHKNELDILRFRHDLEAGFDAIQNTSKYIFE